MENKLAENEIIELGKRTNSSFTSRSNLWSKNESNNNNEHLIDLNFKEYDELKQTLIDLSLPIELKLLNLITDDQAQNNIGSWLNQTETKSSLKTTISTKASSINRQINSQSLSNNYRNFNDWRSHLIYYKQMKGYNKNLPEFFNNLNQKETKLNLENSSNTNLNSKPNISDLLSFTNEQKLNKPILRAQSLDTSLNTSTNLNTTTNTTTATESPTKNKHSNTKLNPSQILSKLIIKNSLNNIQNQNLELNLNIKPLIKNKFNEVTNQKVIPYTKVNRAMPPNSVLRASPRLERPKIRVEQVSSSVFKTIITNNTSATFKNLLTNSNTPTSEDDNTFYTITSLDSNGSNKTKLKSKSKSNKQFITFYRSLEEHDLNESGRRSVEIRSSENEASKSKSNLKFGQPSLTRFIAQSNFIQSNKYGKMGLNLKKFTNGLNKQHEKIIMEQQEQTTCVQASEEVK